MPTLWTVLQTGMLVRGFGRSDKWGKGVEEVELAFLELLELLFVMRWDKIPWSYCSRFEGLYVALCLHINRLLGLTSFMISMTGLEKRRGIWVISSVAVLKTRRH